MMISSPAEPDSQVSHLPSQLDRSPPYPVDLNLACIVQRDVLSPIPSDSGQSSGDASLDHEEYFMLKEAYLKVTDLYLGANLDADKLRDELKAMRAALGVAQ